jgi:putative chitinase
MMLTIEKLQEILPSNIYIEEWYPLIVDNLPNFDIDSSERMAAFLSQCSHESSEFKCILENLNYRWSSLRKVFPKYFPTDELAREYANKPEDIANRVYANRMGNGPEESGDGWKYKGRGLIQITGKNNYQTFADYMEMDIEEVPDYLESFEGALLSACWYWSTNKLNRFADNGDIKGLTKAINGGYNGLQDRIDKYNIALEILS